MNRTLYICYFGVREPLVQTQVIPYLLELRKRLLSRASDTPPDQAAEPLEVTLLTFEPDMNKKWTAEQIVAERASLAEMGIIWHCRAYHKSPSVPATAYDILSGAWYIAKLLRKEQYDVLHGRVHIPTLMGALARKLSKHKPKLLFDIRGFFPEEYTDAGVWPENGWLYRSAKRVESWLLEEADGFVVLTEKAREILFPESRETGFDEFERPVEVIPCCVDIEKFKTANEWSRREVRAELEIGDRQVIVYVGSFGGWYLTDEMLDFFAAARLENPKVFVLVLTQRNTESIAGMLMAKGLSATDFFVGSVTPGELPKYLCAADVAISFIKACYSKLSSSPTKIAEYLACGIPVICNRGVGDIDEQVGNSDIGILLDDFSERAYLAGLAALRERGDVSAKCRDVATSMFDLKHVGGVRYANIYRRLLDCENTE